MDFVTCASLPAPETVLAWRDAVSALRSARVGPRVILAGGSGWCSGSSRYAVVFARARPAGRDAPALGALFSGAPEDV